MTNQEVFYEVKILSLMDLVLLQGVLQSCF